MAPCADFKGVVSEAWKDVAHSSLGSWSEKVFTYGCILDKWGKHTFKNIHKRLR